jgi:hypothetical protein
MHSRDQSERSSSYPVTVAVLQFLARPGAWTDCLDLVHPCLCSMCLSLRRQVSTRLLFDGVCVEVSGVSYDLCSVLHASPPLQVQRTASSTTLLYLPSRPPRTGVERPGDLRALDVSTSIIE